MPPTPSRLDPPPSRAPAAGNPYSPGEDVERSVTMSSCLRSELPAKRAAMRIARNALARAEEQVWLPPRRGARRGPPRPRRFARPSSTWRTPGRSSRYARRNCGSARLGIAQAKRRLDRVAAVRPSGRPRGPAVRRVGPAIPRRPDTVPATPAVPSPNRPAPAPRDRRSRLDDEAGKLAAERDAPGRPVRGPGAAARGVEGTGKRLAGPDQAARGPAAGAGRAPQGRGRAPPPRP